MTKSRLDSARKEEEQQQASGAKVRSEARVRKNWSDMENEFGSGEPTFHSNRKAKKLLPQPATRQSQSIDLRYERFLMLLLYHLAFWQRIQ
jgi:kinesin family protein C2/C3